MYSVGLLSGVQHIYSVIYLSICLSINVLFRFFFIIGYCKILNIDLCAI